MVNKMVNPPTPQGVINTVNEVIDNLGGGAVAKLTNPPTPQGIIDKVNEVIDNLGGRGILETLMEDIVAGNNPVDTTALATAETQIAAFLTI